MEIQIVIIYLYCIIGVLFIIVNITLINVLTAPLIKNGPDPDTTPLVSVCIPVRNEEKTIGHCLQTLIQQDYQNLEIWVLDDHSTDNSVFIISKHSDPRITLIKGQPLPDGWTGKNWACHQLAQRANGTYLIFTDADNFYAPSAISKTVGWMQRLNLSLLSSFPQQITNTWSEKLVIPVIDMFVYSFLVLRFTYQLRYPAMAAANGQWLAFTHAGYKRIGGHISVKSHLVEDTELARRAKKKGEKILTTAGRSAIFGHMYHSWREVWHGFSKNIYGLLGYSFTGLILVLFLLLSLYLVPWILFLFPSLVPLAVSAIGLAAVQRFLLALKFRHPIVISTLLNPLGILAVMSIAVNSYKCYLSGSIGWKDRMVPFKKEL